MPYSYGIRNRYRPSNLAPTAYAWSTRPQYNRADVPTGLLGSDTTVPDEATLLQQFAYEWFQSSQLGGDFNLSNPPFVGGAAGRLLPTLRDAGGAPARILRGYIRRAESEVGDNLSKARLYFMYNPENITRDYVSYLNQSALDPFNTIYQSENLVAPPSILDFSFSLFFDRQEEAGDPDHPGVFVDYQFFDLVVRNVIPTDPNQSNNTVPDNGVMMVNPRDITVVFSPQLTVQGRPLNASVSFEKFTHRMVPVRMTINLTIRAVYMGPLKDQVEYKREQLQSEAAISLEDPIKWDESVSWIDNNDAVNKYFKLALSAAFGAGALDVLTNLLDPDDPSTQELVDTTVSGNREARKAALDWAYAAVKPTTKYNNSINGNVRYNLPDSADCSGLVTEAYIRIHQAAAMGWTGHPGTDQIMNLAVAQPSRQTYRLLSSFDWRRSLEYGDLLIRKGHIKWFVRYTGSAGDSPDAIASRKLICFQAAGQSAHPQVGEAASGWVPGRSEVYYLLRPMPFGAETSLATSDVYSDSLQGKYGRY